MKVVDAKDGSPIAGAFVLFQADVHEGTFLGHGGGQTNLFVIEALTDDSGTLHIPQQKFSAQPYFLNTNYHNPAMLVFKPGYVLSIMQNQRQIIPELRDVTLWEHDNQTIKIKRASTDKEIFDAVHQAASYALRPIQATSTCPWKKIPRFLVAVDRAAAEWNQKRASVADEFLRRSTAIRPLERVLMNEGFYRDEGCGSPKAFFESYLR